MSLLLLDPFVSLLFLLYIAHPQVRSLQVLETVNLMAGGFPHRMRFKNFNSIYWMLAPIKILSRSEELAFDDCKRILDYLKVKTLQMLPSCCRTSNF